VHYGRLGFDAIELNHQVNQVYLLNAADTKSKHNIYKYKSKKSRALEQRRGIFQQS